MQLVPLCFILPDANPLCCLPKNEGLRGGSPVVRFYYVYVYNTQSGQCILFLYNGYGGNENNFESLQQCLETCDGVVCP